MLHTILGSSCKVRTVPLDSKFKLQDPIEELEFLHCLQSRIVASGRSTRLEETLSI